MRTFGRALLAIEKDKANAVQILKFALEANQEEFVRGLAEYLKATLSGVIIDPEAL